jgi:hypothetical protein
LEPDAGLAKSVLERIDLRGILADPRTRLLVGQPPRAAGEAVLEEYLPVIHGGLRAVPLRTACEERPDFFREAADGVREAAELAASDFAVQARLGRRWFVNTLGNLEAAGRPTAGLRRIERAVIAGAGPSLERQAPRIASLRGKAYLIAADAALPALRALGLTPDLVASIDCQWASYHHFLQGFPPGVPLALDLASPPLLARLAPQALFFAGGHPLSRYVSANWRALPALDTSGGNVAQAAVSLAVNLGAREVFLAGLDFAFPGGKAYSRGAFLYPVAASVQTRFLPAETWFLSFLLENRGRGQARNTSRPLSLYRRRLEAFARSVPARLSVLPGAEVELDLPERPPGSGPGNAPPTEGVLRAGRRLESVSRGICLGSGSASRPRAAGRRLPAAPDARAAGPLDDAAAGRRGPAGKHPAERRRACGKRRPPPARTRSRVVAGADRAPVGGLIAAVRARLGG